MRTHGLGLKDTGTILLSTVAVKELSRIWLKLDKVYIDGPKKPLACQARSHPRRRQRNVGCITSVRNTVSIHHD